MTARPLNVVPDHHCPFCFRARDAARDALKPTVEQLQRSAIDLFTRMINPADDAVQEGPAA